VSAGAESIAAAAQRLRAQGEALGRRPAEEVLDVLCRVLDEWRDPDSAIARRDELAAALSSEVGFSPECVREGLQRGLADWSGKALREVVAREFVSSEFVSGEFVSGEFVSSPEARSQDSRDALVHSCVSGFDLTAVLLAGAIPMPTLLAIVLPLVLRSPTLVKTSSRDRVTARHVAESIARVDRELGRCIEIVSFSGSDHACASAFLAADCVVAMGSDETLRRVSETVHPPQRLVAYGHRLSLAIIGPDMRSDSWFVDVADRLALDTALWDQQGCLSPAAVYVMGGPDRARRAALEIARALARAEERWPRGRIATDEAAAIRSQRAEAEMRQAAGVSVELHASADTSWTVVYEPTADWRPTPLQRFLRVYNVDESHSNNVVASLEAALRPIAPHLSAVALEGFGDTTSTIAHAMVRLGASRVCRAGQLQAPPLGWHHDGQPLLLPLARIADIKA